jgi:hypothetical protein
VQANTGQGQPSTILRTYPDYTTIRYYTQALFDYFEKNISRQHRLFPMLPGFGQFWSVAI